MVKATKPYRRRSLTFERLMAALGRKLRYAEKQRLQRTKKMRKGNAFTTLKPK